MVIKFPTPQNHISPPQHHHDRFLSISSGQFKSPLHHLFNHPKTLTTTIATCYKLIPFPIQISSPRASFTLSTPHPFIIITNRLGAFHINNDASLVAHLRLSFHTDRARHSNESRLLRPKCVTKPQPAPRTVLIISQQTNK